MAGLDSIKGFDEGGDVVENNPANITVGKNKYSSSETQSMLDSMQKLIEERENPFARFASGLSKGVATAYGPTALANFEKQQQAQDKQLMDYRQQMAQYRSSLARQEIAKEQLKGFGIGLSASEVSKALPGLTQQQTNKILNSPSLQLQLKSIDPTDSEAQLAVIKDAAKTEFGYEAKSRYDPAYLNKTVEVKVPDKSSPLGYSIEMISPKDYNENPELYSLTPKGNAAIQVAKETSAPTKADINKKVDMPKEEVPLEGLPTPFYAQESSSGKKDTSKPGVQGAQGPMQVTKDTFDTYKAKGIIPKDYDLNDPGQAYASGILILNELHKKHNKDINKVAAEYFGGSGAINADGTINVNRQDANGKNVGDYVNDIRSRMGLPKVDLGVAAPSAAAPSAAAPSAAAPSAAAPSAAAPSAAAPSAAAPSAAAPSAAAVVPTIPQIKAAELVQEKERTAAATKRGESGEAARVEFENDIRPANIIEEKAINKRIQKLVSENPEITGVLAGEGYFKAVAGQLERGIGSVSVNDLSTAILQTLPKTTNLTMAQRNELGTYLARMELKAAKLIKGQGQITEGERAILERASSSLKDPAEAIYKKAKMLERIADMNSELGKIYGNGSKYPNFRDFSMSDDPRVLAIHERYTKDLDNILNEQVNFARGVSGAASTAPKEGEERPSKSGKPTIYKNGQWVYK